MKRYGITIEEYGVLQASARFAKEEAIRGIERMRGLGFSHGYEDLVYSRAEKALEVIKRIPLVKDEVSS